MDVDTRAGSSNATTLGKPPVPDADQGSRSRKREWIALQGRPPADKAAKPSTGRFSAYLVPTACGAK